MFEFLASLFGYLLSFLYNIINNYGIAIILFTVIIKLLLLPLSIKQQRTMKKSAKIQEKMKVIQFKYKNDPEKMNQEVMELYKTEKMSPFSGCLTSILQLVIILSVFWLVSQPLTYMKKIDNNLIDAYTTEMKESGYNSNNSYVQIATIDYAETKYQEISKQLEQENVENREELVKKQQEYNQLRLNMEFLGIDLSKVPTQNLNDWRVYVIPVLYVITSIISTKLTTVTQKKKQKQDIVVSGEEDNKEVDPTEQMQQMSNSMMYMIPVMSVMIAIIAPLGLALYWLASNILMIIERLIINKVMEKDDNKEESSNG